MTSPQTESTQATGVILTDAAAAKAKALLEQEGRDDLRLRVALGRVGAQRGAQLGGKLARHVARLQIQVPPEE